MIVDNIKSTDELIRGMQELLLQLQHLVAHGQSQQPDFLSVVKAFLLDVVSTVIELAEANHPGSALLLYADLETVMRVGGFCHADSVPLNQNNSHHSASGIEPHDMTHGMNYIGQQLAITLFKSLHELPLTLRNDDMMLHGLEALLVNLLRQNFTQNAHQVLDRLCERVHLELNDLSASEMH